MLVYTIRVVSNKRLKSHWFGLEKCCMTRGLYELCVKKNYFTCGDSSQYGKMFDLAENGASSHDIALVIWLCSDNIDFDVIENDVRGVMDV